MKRAIPTAIALGAKQLDCYAKDRGSSLHKLYYPFGARPTGKVSFELNQASKRYKDLNDEAKRENTPDVVTAMILPSSLEEMARRYNKYMSLSEKQKKEATSLDKVKLETRIDEANELYPYDFMMMERDKIIERQEAARARQARYGGSATYSELTGMARGIISG